MKRTTYLFAAVILVFAGTSCKKENNGSGLKAVFSYVADGYKVNFTNFSSNAKEYSWDFGDGSGETSTLKAPQHIFTRKGDFLVSLTAKNGAETNTFIDTVSIIGPNIKIDGDFTDWQYVEYTYTNPETFAGSVRAVKTFASSQEVYFYLEGNEDMNMEIIDLYIDADNDPATGFATWLYPAGSGADFLCEGSPIGGWGDIFSHVGPGTGWGWAPASTFADATKFSTLSETGGKKIIEFSIKKSVLGSVSGAINFCLIESTSGWAEVGKIPESQLPASKFIALPL